jgi:hypothetical protein
MAVTECITPFAAGRGRRPCRRRFGTTFSPAAVGAPYEHRQIPATRERVPEAEILTFPGGHLTTSEHPGLLAAAMSTGGGSARSEQLRRATDEATYAALDRLAPMITAGCVSHVSLVLGADARAPVRWRHVPWLTVIPGPVELTELYPAHELLVARAGRNTIAEAAHSGIPAT